MTKAGERIIASARQALAYARGEVAEGFVVHEPGEPGPRGGGEVPDVRAIRERLGLSQAEFARRFGFGLATVRSWEQGRRAPLGSSRVLLRVIEREPDAVSRALAA